MDAVEDIKSRLSIEDVISRYVELKRAGRNFRGLSPFNNEKTPSFMVSPEKQIWHDFSSGKGGNMFSFVMEVEGIDFKAALELLARQAGIDLSQYQAQHAGQRSQHKERLYQALDLAAKFYQIHFSKNRQALEYILKKRGFSKDIALAFRIGYAPDTGNSLTKFMLSKGFTLQELKTAGLTTQRYREPGDMFRGRIMIPLMDPFGKVIGFTARLLSDDPKAPKYINTPQSPLYDKSRHVFGLHLAKEAIRKKGYAVVVEGNLDVITSHQAGIKEVVATAGTAMTDAHFKVIGRLTSDIRIAFDQDNAGLQAAERTIPLAGKADVSLSILTVTEGKDPDELIRKGADKWQQVIDSPQYALDWLIERYQGLLDINSAQGKREFSDILVKVIRELPDSVEQDHYITRIAELISVSPDALRTKLVRGSKNERRLSAARRAVRFDQVDKEKAELLKTQNHLLAIMLMQPGLRMYLKRLTEDMLPEKAAQTLFKILETDPKATSEEILTKIIYMDGSSDSKLFRELTAQGTGEGHKEAVHDMVTADLQQHSDVSSSSSSVSSSSAEQARTLEEFTGIMVLLYEELYKSLELLDLRYEAAQLQARLIQQYVKTKKTELAHIMRERGETPALLNQAKLLDELLKTARIK